MNYDFSHRKMGITRIILLDVIVWEVGLILIISIMSGWII